MKYGIEVGQIYLAADGSKCGHLVTDVTTFANCDDVVTNPFNQDGFKGNGNRIDAFKLAMVRYSLVDKAPEWMPDSETNGSKADVHNPVRERNDLQLLAKYGENKLREMGYMGVLDRLERGGHIGSNAGETK